MVRLHGRKATSRMRDASKPHPWAPCQNFPGSTAINKINSKNKVVFRVRADKLMTSAFPGQKKKGWSYFKRWEGGRGVKQKEKKG